MIDTKLRIEKRQQLAKEYTMILSLFLLFGFLINAGIRIKGLYMDDLYLWSCYGEYPLSYYLFPTGGERFRFMFNGLAYVVLKLMGTHIVLTVPINICLNSLIALTIYHCTRQIGKKPVLSFLCGIAYLLSRFSYYQVGQLYGLLETFSLWGAIVVLYLIYRYINHERGEKYYFIAANIVYFFTSFIHERYMVLAVLLCSAVVLRHIMKRQKDYRLLIWPVCTFILIMGIRYLAIGSLFPAGTGGSSVADTFTVTDALGFAINQVQYIFGINAGPEHLNGISWEMTPRLIKLLIFFADAALLISVSCFLAAIILNKTKRREYLCNTAMFLIFLAMCIGASSVTIRLEMRWIYVSYTAALFFLTYLYRAVAETKKTLIAVKCMLAVYFLLLLPVELFYRDNFDHLYYYDNQQRYNSLAEVTYETYGDEIFDKTIIILENKFEIDEFTANTFWKPYNEKMIHPMPNVVFADSIKDFGLVTNNMVILEEDRKHNRYIDVTDFVRQQKCNVAYGYYEDNWMDQKAEMTIISGPKGEISFHCYYPGKLNGGEEVRITVDGKETLKIPVTDNYPQIIIPVEENREAALKIEMNFYTQDALEMRGDYPLGMLVTMEAY